MLTTLTFDHSVIFEAYCKLNKIYAESRNEEDDAETKVETADEKVKACQKALEDAKMALEIY